MMQRQHTKKTIQTKPTMSDIEKQQLEEIKKLKMELEEVKKSVPKKCTPEELKEKRMAALQKAREIRKTNIDLVKQGKEPLPTKYKPKKKKEQVIQSTD